MKKYDLKLLVKLATVAAIYVALTMLLQPIAFGEIQFRISEVLVLLCFYRKEYAYSMIIGCMLANIISPYGIVDVFFGTMATAISVFCITKSKNLLIASLYPTIFNGLIIALEIVLYEQITPFWPSFSLFALTIALGEFGVVSIVGVFIFKLLEKNIEFMKLIGANMNYYKDDNETE